MCVVEIPNKKMLSNSVCVSMYVSFLYPFLIIIILHLLEKCVQMPGKVCDIIHAVDFIGVQSEYKSMLLYLGIK